MCRLLLDLGSCDIEVTCWSEVPIVLPLLGLERILFRLSLRSWPRQKLASLNLSAASLFSSLVGVFTLGRLGELRGFYRLSGAAARCGLGPILIMD